MFWCAPPQSSPSLRCQPTKKGISSKQVSFSMFISPLHYTTVPPINVLKRACRMHRSIQGERYCGTKVASTVSSTSGCDDKARCVNPALSLADDGLQFAPYGCVVTPSQTTRCRIAPATTASLHFELDIRRVASPKRTHRQESTSIRRFALDFHSTAAVATCFTADCQRASTTPIVTTYSGTMEAQTIAVPSTNRKHSPFATIWCSHDL